MVIQEFVPKLAFDRKGYSVLKKSEIKSLIISGKSLEKLHIQEILKNKIENFDHLIIGDERRSVSEINKLIKNYKKNTYSSVIAFGGGSVIDIAKLFVAKFKEINNETSFYVIPTLIGSGAESSKTSIQNSENGKIISSDIFYLPEAVIYDTEILSTIPKKEILFGGIDAISHCIESKFTILTNPYIKFLSDYTLKYFFDNVCISDLHKNETLTKEELVAFCITSYNGGLAQSNSGAGLCHAFAHASEKILSCSHNRSIAYFLKATMIFLNQENKSLIDSKNSYLFDLIYEYLSELKKYEDEFILLEQASSDVKIKSELIRNAKIDPCWRLSKLKGNKEAILDNYL
tara:strand:+ start:3586 stop:4623 length:1038 start_codon:yes stop_codon:yes gene_type:complete